MAYVQLRPDEQRAVEVRLEGRWVAGWLVAQLKLDDAFSWGRVYYNPHDPGTHIGWFEESRMRAVG